jgi:sec-independent protein translocase protein TatA
MVTPLFAWTPGWPELVVVLVVALLLFGRRLPEVGRSLGKGLVEFKKGLKDVGDDVKDVKDSADKAGESEPEAEPKATSKASESS